MTRSATLEDLARRAVALPGWRWEGFHEHGKKLLSSMDDGSLLVRQMPIDLTNPATLGCLMALAGWPSTNMGQRPWVWGRVDGVRYDGVGDSLAEALVVYAEAVGRWPGVPYPGAPTRDALPGQVGVFERVG